MINRLLQAVSLLFLSIITDAQNVLSGTITIPETVRIEKTLSADNMRGRGAFTPDIDKAANFIANEFRKAGLKPLSGTSYLQRFQMLQPRLVSAKIKFDSTEIRTGRLAAFTTKPLIEINEKSGYKIERINEDDNLYNKASSFLNSQDNLLVIVNTIHSSKFGNLERFRSETFPVENTIIFLLSDTIPLTFTIELKHEFTTLNLANVAGILPGKAKKDEYVIFSAHYDHLGVGLPGDDKDSIYNGANDDASGTTAVILLADYFKKIKKNERTIIFVAFTAEEEGGYGSQYFSKQLDPSKVTAMFNIEMIGTKSKWGSNSAYITGFEKTNMGKILQNNLRSTKFNFYPDPYPDQNLFYRSDNASLATFGVPAHTISTSKMDSEKYYHTPADEFKTLDIGNMTEIIRSIALSSTSIVEGKDTPSRVKN